MQGSDANTLFSDGQAFTFTGAAAFDGKPGVLRLADGALTGDTTGDGRADFETPSSAWTLTSERT